MFTEQQYQLIDFGGGRKLERFGPVLLDRPSPAAQRHRPAHPERWGEATARYERVSADRGRWTSNAEVPKTWNIKHDSSVFELKLTPFGHLGIFAEQAENWDWIARHVSRAAKPLNVLNLFAYTGGSTLAVAQAGGQVVHVDSAKNVVSWARRNAQLSGLKEAPIRWVAEDARRFVAREVRRGNRYDAVILDPPTYGHGSRGESWNIGRDLLPLLRRCAELTDGQPKFFLITCHSAGFGPAELQACLADAIFGSCRALPATRRLSLRTEDGRRLNAGVVARWPR